MTPTGPGGEPITTEATIARGLTIYVGGVPVLTARKVHELIAVGKQAGDCHIVLPWPPEPIHIYDHGWLMMVASDAYMLAGRLILEAS